MGNSRLPSQIALLVKYIYLTTLVPFSFSEILLCHLMYRSIRIFSLNVFDYKFNFSNRQRTSVSRLDFQKIWKCLVCKCQKLVNKYVRLILLYFLLSSISNYREVYWCVFDAYLSAFHECSNSDKCSKICITRLGTSRPTKGIDPSPTRLGFTSFFSNQAIHFLWFNVYILLFYYAGKECKKPKAPKDGRSTGKSYEVGKVVRFRCNPGYQREGLVAITCLPSLRWSARPPKCKPFKQGNL